MFRAHGKCGPRDGQFRDIQSHTDDGSVSTCIMSYVIVDQIYERNSYKVIDIPRKIVGRMEQTFPNIFPGKLIFLEKGIYAVYYNIVFFMRVSRCGWGHASRGGSMNNAQL